MSARDPQDLGAIKIRCPKCRSADLTACEFTVASMLFEIRGGRMKRLSHTEDFDRILDVELDCDKCRHHWRPRGVHDVMGLLVEAP